MNLVTLDDIESGIGDSADQCSSTCTLCNERKISNATTTAPQKRIIKYLINKLTKIFNCFISVNLISMNIC